MRSYIKTMIRKKNLIAIIPVRKNSKGIKYKNILKINNKTLLERKILLSKKNKYIDKTIVSTDCKIMFKIAKKHNINIDDQDPYQIQSRSNRPSSNRSQNIRKYKKV